MHSGLGIHMSGRLDPLQRRVPLCCLARGQQSVTAAQGAPGGRNLGEKDDDVSKARIGKSKARIRRVFPPPCY